MTLFSEKNAQSLDDVYNFAPNSKKEFYWKCENNIHDDYIRAVDKQNRFDGRCPICSQNKNESILQKKVRLYLEQVFGKENVLHETDCLLKPINPRTNNFLKYDNEIIGKNFVVEVMGVQHHSKKAYGELIREKNAELIEKGYSDLLYRDSYKKEYALKNNYLYLDIWYFDDDKKETWKSKICSLIKKYKLV